MFNSKLEQQSLVLHEVVNTKGKACFLAAWRIFTSKSGGGEGGGGGMEGQHFEMLMFGLEASG